MTFRFSQQPLRWSSTARDVGLRRGAAEPKNPTSKPSTQFLQQCSRSQLLALALAFLSALSNPAYHCALWLRSRLRASTHFVRDTSGTRSTFTSVLRRLPFGTRCHCSSARFSRNEPPCLRRPPLGHRRRHRGRRRRRRRRHDRRSRHCRTCSFRQQQQRRRRRRRLRHFYGRGRL